MNTYLRIYTPAKVRDGRHGEGDAHRTTRPALRAGNGPGFGKRRGGGPEGGETGGGGRDGEARNRRGGEVYIIYVKIRQFWGDRGCERKGGKGGSGGKAGGRRGGGDYYRIHT